MARSLASSRKRGFGFGLLTAIAGLTVSMSSVALRATDSLFDLPPDRFLPSQETASRDNAPVLPTPGPRPLTPGSKPSASPSSAPTAPPLSRLPLTTGGGEESPVSVDLGAFDGQALPITATTIDDGSTVAQSPILPARPAQQPGFDPLSPEGLAIGGGALASLAVAGWYLARRRA